MSEERAIEQLRERIEEQDRYIDILLTRSGRWMRRAQAAEAEVMRLLREKAPA
jgi:hypothetical protein